MRNKQLANKNVTFTNSQTELLDDIGKWFYEDRSLSYTISGSAGTGKTFIVNYIIKNILSNQRVVVSAPTHKAVRVIEKFTGITGFTLHSLHGLRPNFNLDNFNIDKVKFEALGTNKFGKYNVIIVDECSMISKDLKKLNDIRSLQYNTKIIYVGDKLQLLPVKETTLSRVFENEYSTELLEIVRQSDDNPMHVLFELLRKDIVNDGASFINYIKKHRVGMYDKIGYNVLPNKEFQLTALEAFKSKEFKNNTDSFKVTAYSNARVNIWNKLIRRSITRDKTLIVKGDVLMGYKTIVDDYLSPIVINGDDYIVNESQAKMSDYGFKLFLVDIEDLATHYRKKIHIVDHTDESFNNFIVKLRSLHTAALYGDVLKKGELWKNYYKFKETYMTMIDFPIDTGKSNNPTYVKKEIDYGYAVTVHKLQGSTIKNIFLDAMEIVYVGGNADKPRVNNKYNKGVIELRNRLLYTALSRASERGIIMFK